MVTSRSALQTTFLELNAFEKKGIINYRTESIRNDKGSLRDKQKKRVALYFQKTSLEPDTSFKLHTNIDFASENTKEYWPLTQNY